MPFNAQQELALFYLTLKNLFQTVKKSPVTPAAATAAADGWHPTEFRLAPAGVNEDMVISGHLDLNTLYASNDVTTGPITVNVCNAPNNSTDQCG